MQAGSTGKVTRFLGLGAIKPILQLCYARPMFTGYLKKRMQDLLGYGIAMEGLALMEQIDPAK